MSSVVSLRVDRPGDDGVDDQHDEEADADHLREAENIVTPIHAAVQASMKNAVMRMRWRVGGDREDQSGKRQHQQDVRDVGADDVAVGEAGIAGRWPPARRDEEFRHRRAEADNHDADQQGRDVRLVGRRKRAAHEAVSRIDQDRKAR